MTSEPRKSQDERDHAQDAYIAWPQAEARSSLSWIATHRDELIAKFMLWVTIMEPAGVSNAALVRWEIETFGTALYPAAHGILSHGVKLARGFVDKKYV